MSVFLTIFTGVTVFVLGQLVIKLVVDPIHALKTTIGEVSNLLILHADVYSNPGIHIRKRNDTASEEFRLSASKLAAHVFLIPKFDLTASLFGLPSRDKLHEAKSELIGLSNGLHDKGPDGGRRSLGEINSGRAKKICEALGIYMPESARPDA